MNDEEAVFETAQNLVIGFIKNAVDHRNDHRPCSSDILSVILSFYLVKQETALLSACYHGLYELAECLLNKGSKEDREQNGLTALALAVEGGYDDIVQLLVISGINIDALNENGNTLLFDAVSDGNINGVKALLAHDADVNLRSGDCDDTPLIEACYRGHHEIVAYLVNVPEIDIDAKRKTDGATSLFIASREGSTECVRYLLSNQGININIAKDNGRTPLFIASFFGHFEIVELLIETGNISDVDACDSKGFTALFVAAQNNQIRVASLLLKNSVCSVCIYIHSVHILSSFRTFAFFA